MKVIPVNKVRMVNIIIFLLVLLWSYAAASKLADYPASRTAMLGQPLDPRIAGMLTWLVPVAEIIAVFLLLFVRTQKAGLIFSWWLTFLFTVYTALVLGNTFGRIPCSCGGLFQSMSWHQHLYFNSFFLLLISGALLLKADRSILYNPFNVLRKEVPGNRKA